MAVLLVNAACGNSCVDGLVNLDNAPVSTAVFQAHLLERLPLDDAVADVMYSSQIPSQLVRNWPLKVFKDNLRRFSVL